MVSDAVLAGASQALSAARTGQLAGRGAVLALGVVLVLDGVRRRRRRSTPEPLAVAPGAPAGALSVLPAPRGRRGRNVPLVVGWGLLVLFAVGTARAVTHGTHHVQRHVALPPSVLGLPLNEAMTARASSTLEGEQPSAGPGARIAVYGAPPHAVLVLATPHGSNSPDRAISDIKAGDERTSGVTLGVGTRVAAGPLGGSGRCWNNALRATPAELCVFVDAGSAVTVYDVGVTNPATTARRALTVREAALRR